jgi:hypothetical protein
MKPRAVFLVALVLLLAVATDLKAVEAPLEIAGFKLGRSIDEYADRVQMDTQLCVRYMEYFHEVEIKPLAGFKSGLVGFGTCRVPGRILRIKLKYADASKKFYKQLLKRYTRRFGKPHEYRGDPFHVLIAWKWSLVDRDHNKISMILQHNTQDREEKMGNAVKMTLVNLLEEEAACFDTENPDLRAAAKAANDAAKRLTAIDWDRLIPR